MGNGLEGEAENQGSVGMLYHPFPVPRFLVVNARAGNDIAGESAGATTTI
jgi:hypothetical protein